ncbi:MAG: hypothetical protein CL842_11135 [Crocinitomicaceae bacterium]|nr:hypothetical protein [Crocinitomicaceae bacterium]|tara:strand:- start:101577 stop:102917 length:1341 start_codon:yes stop_codon:yes gene_type:complete
MFYKTLKLLFTLTTKAYFRSITIHGKEDLPPKNTPVIFAANHPSAFMDPILLGAFIKRPLYFLARGDIFSNKFARSVFNLMHMIPVYKAEDSPGQMHKNASTVEKCYDHLGENKTILIFPEGVSKTERRLREIKTGTARIALGAEEKHDFKLGLTIIPVGLNYSNPHLFKSDVLVNFGKPIIVSDYKDSFTKDAREAVVQLTVRIKSDLEAQMIVIENEELEKTIENIETLYRSALRQDNSEEAKGSQDFKLSQDIVKAVEHFAQHEPAILIKFQRDIKAYLDDLEQSQLSDKQIRSASIKLDVIRKFAYFLIGFPFFLFGLITNFIPFKLTGIITRAAKAREDFVGAVTLAVGLFVFLIIYGLETWAIASYTNNIVGLFFLISLYPAGLFTINYFVSFYKLQITFKYLSVFVRKSDLITRLKTDRQALIDELEKRKADYLEFTKA